MQVDVVSLFALIVFAGSWWAWARSSPGEPLTRLFFAMMMILSAGAGLAGWLLRQISQR